MLDIINAPTPALSSSPENPPAIKETINLFLSGFI